MRRLIPIGLSSAVLVVCLGAVTGCRAAGPCGWIVNQGNSLWPAAFGPPLLVASVAIFAWAVRFGVTAARASNELGKVRRLEVPRKLARIAASTGVERVVCVEGVAPVAFCAGLFVPRVFVSEGAVASLSEPECAAVLHHEADHARRHEPLRRAARSAAADVLSFLPIVPWWSERQVMRSELTADIAAERMVGRSALAGALLAMTAPVAGMPAFVGQVELRAQRLLGATLAQPAPSPEVWAATVVYSWLAFSVAGCLLEVFTGLR